MSALEGGLPFIAIYFSIYLRIYRHVFFLSLVIFRHILSFTAIYHHMLPSITIYHYFLLSTAIYGRLRTFGGSHHI
jgi:hypothetical protein